METVLATLDPRDLRVLQLRVFTETPQSLDEIAAELDVSRERVRQLLARAQTQFLDGVQANQAVQELIAKTLATIGAATETERLLATLPELSEQVPSAGVALWQVLTTGVGGFEVSKQWAAVPSLKQAEQDTVRRLREAANQFGVAAVTQTNLGAPAQWLDHMGIPTSDGYALLDTQRLVDYAAAVLFLRDAPMSVPQIQEACPPPRNPRSIANALRGDERFVRVGRGLWNLAEPTGKPIGQLEPKTSGEYRGIRHAITQALQQRGGEMELEELAKLLASRYAVAPKSVRAYAATPPFTVDGTTVRIMQKPEDEKGPQSKRHHSGRKAGEAPGVRRFPGGWSYQIKVNSNHLRGSGTPIPVALAETLGLRRGEATTFPSEGKGQRVSWKSGTQVVLGTLRARLQAMGAQQGDTVFALFGDDGTFALTNKPPNDCKGGHAPVISR